MDEPEPTNVIDLTSRRRKKNQPLPHIGAAYRSDTVYPERIVQLRELLGFSQEDFAEVMGFQLQAVQAWENGTAQPMLEQLEDMATISGMVTAAWFCKSPPEWWSDWEQTSLRFH